MYKAKQAIWGLRNLGLIFWLQVTVLAAATGSVEAAGWVDTLPLFALAFLATLLAAFVAKRRNPLKLLHLWATIAGIILAYAGCVYLADSEHWLLKFGELNGRIVDWWKAVTGDDVTTDTLPLSMILMAITWFVSYFTSWALFRFQVVWASLVPLGAGTIINLTYLSEQYYVYFFAFLFVGMLLLIHVTSLKRQTDLEIQGINYPRSINRISLYHGLWLSAIALAIVIVLPVSKAPPTPLKMAISPVNQSVESLRSELHRIFAVIPGHNLASMRFFGSVLPLVRPVPTGNNAIFLSNSGYPLYWPATAYDEYTSTAWKVGGTATMPIAYDVEGSIGEEEESIALSASSINYAIKMFVDSPYLMISGTPLYLPPGAQQQLAKSPSYNIDLDTPLQNNTSLPTDLQMWAQSIASEADGGSLTKWQLPPNILVTKVVKDLPNQGKKDVFDIDTEARTYQSDLTQALESIGRTVGLEVNRGIDWGSVIAYKPLERLTSNSEYEVTDDLILPSVSALRYSSLDYPPMITDRYLQLPESLPSRVKALAQSLTRNAGKPYEKAVVIETYLRNLKYTPASYPLPHDVDVVDHFLFESQEGYGDYFASAMAVMLRAINIPTRLILGFGPGQHAEKVGFMVRDKDSHSWPEVYFSNIGWVPFEPTPIYDLRTRGTDSNPLGYFGISQWGAEEEGGEDQKLQRLEENPEGERIDQGGPLPGGGGARPPLTRHFGTPLGIGGAFFAIFLIMGGFVMRVLWWRQYGGLREPSTAFERMRRLATFMGVPSPLSQTPYELARSLSRAMPEATEDIKLICDCFVLHRYGGRTPTTLEELRVKWAWYRMKKILLSQTTRQGKSLSHTT